jgi:hypothetical protein
MNAEEDAADGARPLRPFGFDEAADSAGPDGAQIVDHAHSVSRPVAFVQIFQPEAGKFRASETESAGPLLAKKDPTMAVA